MQPPPATLLPSAAAAAGGAGGGTAVPLKSALSKSKLGNREKDGSSLRIKSRVSFDVGPSGEAFASVLIYVISTS